MTRGRLAVICVLGLALSGLSFPASETNLLTVHGEAWILKPRIPAGAGYTVTVTNITQAKTVSVVLGPADQGKYAVVFVDYSTNRAAVAGDALEVTLVDPTGKIVGETARTILEESAIDSRLVEIDVNPVSVPAIPATWGSVKALFR